MNNSWLQPAPHPHESCSKATAHTAVRALQAGVSSEEPLRREIGRRTRTRSSRLGIDLRDDAAPETDATLTRADSFLNQPMRPLRVFL